MSPAEVPTLCGTSGPFSTWLSLGLCLCEKQSSTLLVQEGDAKGHSHLENILIVSSNVRHILNTRPRDLTPGSLPELNENLHAHPNLYTNIHNSFIHNHWKLQTTQLSFNNFMNRQTGTLFTPWNKLLTHATAQMNFECILSNKSQTQKGKTRGTENRLVTQRTLHSKGWISLSVSLASI